MLVNADEKISQSNKHYPFLGDTVKKRVPGRIILTPIYLKDKFEARINRLSW
jgi:hypothetical protein